MSKFFCDICKQWHDPNVSCKNIPNQSNQKMEGKKLEISWEKDKGKFINLFMILMFSMASFLGGGFYKGSSTPVVDTSSDALKQEIATLHRQIDELTKELNNKNYQNYTDSVSGLEQEIASIKKLNQDISKKQDAIEKTLNPNLETEVNTDIENLVNHICAYTGVSREQALTHIGEMLHEASSNPGNSIQTTDVPVQNTDKPSNNKQ